MLWKWQLNLKIERKTLGNLNRPTRFLSGLDNFNIHENEYFQVGQRYSNDKAKRDKWSDAEEEEDEDKSLILGKYKYLEEVPREVRSNENSIHILHTI